MSVDISHQPIGSLHHYKVDEGLTMNSTDALTHRFLAQHLHLNVNTVACITALSPSLFHFIAGNLSNLGPFNITDLSPFVPQLVPSVLQANRCS